MNKELIRNGSFERGNYDFWTCLGAFEIQSAEKKYGSYASKITIGADFIGMLATKDYIPVSPYALYKFTGWLKNAQDILHLIVAQTFDGDLQAIGGDGIPLVRQEGVFDWTKVECFFAIDDEASYIKIGDGMAGGDGDIGYHDAFSLLRLNVENIIVHNETLVAVEDLAADDTYYSEEFFTGLWKIGEFVLDVTSLTGTTPTLNVTIEAYDPTTETWITMITFTEATGVTTEKKQNINAAYIGLGWENRVKYVTAGTITDCDFKVGAVYKR